MPRVKGGTVTRKRRKKVLKLAKGYFGSKHTLYKVANQQVMKSGNYAFRDRRQKKRDFRKLWITRINAAARMNGLSYSRLMHGLKLASMWRYWSVKTLYPLSSPKKRRPVFSWGQWKAGNAADVSCLCFLEHQEEQLPSSANAQAGPEACLIFAQRFAVLNADTNR